MRKIHSNLLAFQNIALQPGIGAVGCVNYGICSPTALELGSRIRKWQTRAFARLCMAQCGAETAYDMEQRVLEAQGHHFHPDERPKAIDRMLHPGEPGIGGSRRQYQKPNASAAILDELMIRNASELRYVQDLPLWPLLNPKHLLPYEIETLDHRLRELGAPPPIPEAMRTAEERRMFVHFYYVFPKNGDPALGLARMLWELRCKETVSHLGHYVELSTWLTSYREPFESPIMRALGPELPLHLLQCFGRLCFPMVRTPRELKDLRWALRRLGVQLRAADGSGSTPSEYRFRLIDRRPESQWSDTGRDDVDVLRVTQGGRPPNAVQVP